MSDQLYDDPFRFFFELIQNADDAKFRLGTTPTIRFTVSRTALVVEINEIGFTLADVLSICNTGESSNAEIDNTIGEKGFGFKSVFGIASTVHVRSGLWSFRFEHERNQDGLGMVSPIWEAPHQDMPGDYKTRFTLKYTETDVDLVDYLCRQFACQSETVVWSLRQIRVLEITFDDDGSRDNLRFEHVPVSKPYISQIKSSNGHRGTLHTYWQIDSRISPMPERKGRTGNVLTVTIALPITNPNDCNPKISSQGEYIFAYLPVCRLPQLPFLIQGDFLLPASRQAVSETAWNRALRLGVASTFVSAVRDLLTMTIDDPLALTWLRFLPTSRIEGFWEPLGQSLIEGLAGQPVFFAANGSKHIASDLRRVPDFMLYDGKPLFEPHRQQLFSLICQEWQFLSTRYASQDYARLEKLGVRLLSDMEIVELIRTDLALSTSRIRGTPLKSTWHDAFLELAKTLWEREMLESMDWSSPQRSLEQLAIVPIQTGEEMIWQTPASGGFYFATVIDDGSGDNRVQIDLPTDIGFPFIVPDACCNQARKLAYSVLGAKSAAKDHVQLCKSIIAKQDVRVSRYVNDCLRDLEILYWFSSDTSPFGGLSLKAVAHNNSSRQSCRQLFFQSSDEMYAACLLRLHESDKHHDVFLHPRYQNSPVAKHLRGH